MIKKLALFAFLAFPAFAQASETKGVNFFNVPLEKNYDGDTIFVNLKEYPAIFGRISVRILGIDTAEMHSKVACEKADALKAKEILSDLLKGNQLDLLDCGRDKYFRLLCRAKSGQTDISEYMIKSGYARPYFGDKKAPWVCISH